MKKLCVLLLTLSLLLAGFTGCAAGNKNSTDGGNIRDFLNKAPTGGKDAYDEVMEGMDNAAAPDADATNRPTFIENPFIATQQEPVSTFSADVDTASYSYFRKLVNSNYQLDELFGTASNFRTEEFLNYFRYQANAPKENELFGVTTAIAKCPWNPDTMLMRLTLQAEETVPETGNNLVFLIDVSGSMSSSDKLPLLKKAFSYLVGQLTEADRVSIVTYSGKEAVILEGCPGNQSEKIMEKINSLKASGATNGERGLRMAYNIAEKNMIAGGNNRIILASDGDLNVGIYSNDELKAFVEEKRDSGVYLSTLGFGTGNYRDSKMEILANNGNGIYYYIDGEAEAEKVFGTDILSMLYTVAKDVKLQITFDPSVISSYRLIGYENRILNKEDFEDDTKDAGEVGAGHQVTVFYELTVNAKAEEKENWMTLAVRYKQPDANESLLNEYSIGCSSLAETPDADFTFMTALIETCMYLHRSTYLQDIDLDHILDILNKLDLTAYPDRAEFRDLIRKLQSSGK